MQCVSCCVLQHVCVVVYVRCCVYRSVYSVATLLCLWQVFELLKAAVTRSLKDEQVQSGSMFVQGLIPQSQGVTHMILDTVRHRSAHQTPVPVFRQG